MKKIVFCTLFIISCIVFTAWARVRIVASVEFNNNCGGYLERASNANSIELAEKNLTKAIEYLDRNNLTQGQVSIFMNQPKNDISYWYANLKTAQMQLRETSSDITSLEESNILMKLRETVTDGGKNGTILVHPSGISIYPHNALYFWLCLLSLIGMVVFSWLTFYYWDD